MEDVVVNDQRAAAHPSGLDPDARATLEEARECLSYWEGRARSLPLHAVAQRREAREMTTRWRARTARAEREAYGEGLLGALLLLAAERRLPEPTRHAGHRMVRAGTRAVVVLAVLTVVVVLAMLAAVAGLLITIF